MMSSATRLLERSASLGALASVAAVAVLSAGPSRAQAAHGTAAAEAAPPARQASVERGLDPVFAERFPNVVLKTHEGRNVRFYDDLLKDKIVLINFMYATCTER